MKNKKVLQINKPNRFKRKPEESLSKDTSKKKRIIKWRYVKNFLISLIAIKRINPQWDNIIHLLEYPKCKIKKIPIISETIEQIILSCRVDRSLSLKNQFGSSFDIVNIANIHILEDAAILSLDIYTYALQKMY